MESCRFLFTHNLIKSLKNTYLGISLQRHLSMASKSEGTSKRIYVSRKLPDDALRLLTQSRHEVSIWPKSDVPVPRGELLKQINGVHGLVCILTDKIDSEVLDAAGKNLEVVSTMSVGYDHVDVTELKTRKIRLGNTPDVLTEATAELTLALLLMTARRLLEAADKARSGEWGAWSPTWMCGTSLKGKTIGIVGMGRIGLAVANLLLPFGVQNIIYSANNEKKAASEFKGELVSFDQLLERSDVVIACCALNKQTAGLFDKNAFRKMKQDSIFINTSRGGVVNQDDLINALTNGDIKAAGLDVTSPEPLPVDNKLFQLPNCVVLPHVGSAEIQTRTAMAVLAARNLLAGLDGEKMPAEVI